MPYPNIFVNLRLISLLTTSIPTRMKKQVLALALLCCCLIGFAKDKRPINYRFHKNDTINILKVVERDSTKKTTKYQIVVLEAKGSKAVLKFKGIPDPDGFESFMNNPSHGFIKNKENFLNKIQSLSLSSVSPIIRYKNGKPKGMVNFKEMKTSTLVLLDSVFSISSQLVKDAPDSMKVKEENTDSVMTMIKQIMRPLMEEFMTEELMMSQYSDMVQSSMPQKLGKWSETKGGALGQYSLTATQNAGEYEYHDKAKIELSKEDLSNPQLKDNPAVEAFTEMGGLGKLMVAFLDSFSFERTTNGVICSNGIPKHFVKETKGVFSVMGRKKKSTQKVTISVIDK